MEKERMLEARAIWCTRKDFHKDNNRQYLPELRCACCFKNRSPDPLLAYNPPPPETLQKHN